jgi:hypothetical protein
MLIDGSVILCIDLALISRPIRCQLHVEESSRPSGADRSGEGECGICPFVVTFNRWVSEIAAMNG